MGTGQAYCIRHPLFGTHSLHKHHAMPLIQNTTRFAKKKAETFSSRQARKPQFAVTRLQFRVAEISNFSKAFSSVQFIFI